MTTTQTTPTRDEAVRRVPDLTDWLTAKAVISGPIERAMLNTAASTLHILASAPAPASGGVDAVAWSDVLAERRRQVEAEGWTAAHDDEHGNGEMARAAASYALEHAAWTYTETPSARLMEAARSVWPWGKQWWKPGAGRGMLVKAAALILAEIERLDRKEGAR